MIFLFKRKKVLIEKSDKSKQKISFQIFKGFNHFEIISLCFSFGIEKRNQLSYKRKFIFKKQFDEF